MRPDHNPKIITAGFARYAAAISLLSLAALLVGCPSNNPSSPNNPPTSTNTPVPTATITSTPSNTPTNTPTSTATNTPTNTATPTITPTFVCSGASGSVGLNTTDGTNTTTTDHMYVSRYQFAQNSRVTDIQVVACSGTINVGIYSDVAGSPGTLVSPVASQVSSSCAVTQTISFPGSGVGLPAGYYWLAVGSSSNVFYALNNGVGTNIASYGAGSGSLPSPFSGPLTFSFSAAPQMSADWVCP